MNSPIIDLQGVCLQRDDKVILDKVTWRVNPGEHWAFIGKNGSGKTVTLRLVTGYLWPTSGEIQVLGHRFGEYDLRELRKEIGWVSLDIQYKLQRPFGVLDVIVSGQFASLGLYDKPTPEMFEKALGLLDFMQCRELEKRTFNTLSYGEQKRIIIARALMGSPKLLILDEPCTGLDLVARESFLNAVQELGQKKDGPTIIYVSHHIEEIMPFVTHCHLIKDGKSVAMGPKNEIIQDQLLSQTLDLSLSVTNNNQRFWVQINH